jgi:hypothetical protein
MPRTRGTPIAIAIALLAGVVLGALGGPVWILLIWAAAAFVCGALARSRREAIIAGLLFGFVVSFVFLARGYNGAEPLVTRLPSFAALALFGAGCGALLSGASAFVWRARRA